MTNISNRKYFVLISSIRLLVPFIKQHLGSFFFYFVLFCTTREHKTSFTDLYPFAKIFILKAKSIRVCSVEKGGPTPEIWKKKLRLSRAERSYFTLELAIAKQ